ncbi:MAG: phosphoribosylglycinamide formyltransferase [Nitrospira sp. SB0662_bin_26]|nr:phosphoribosylglycinamide formyltransferase [Nitrospira sp. SB0662_bin_26]
MNVLRLGVLVSGRGSNLRAIINEIEAGTLKAEIAVVISNKQGVPALEHAERHGLHAVFLDPKSVAGMPDPRQAYDRKLLETLRHHQVQLVVLAGYMKIVTSVLIDAYESRIMNIHPSLLPNFPGLHAQQQALDHGVKVAGCTVHFVTEGMDTGPIILQRAVPVEEGDTADILSERILKEEHGALPRAIQLFAEGRLRVEGRVVHIRHS